jgi:hypothetical protein
MVATIVQYTQIFVYSMIQTNNLEFLIQLMEGWSFARPEEIIEEHRLLSINNPGTPMTFN